MIMTKRSTLLPLSIAIGLCVQAQYWQKLPTGVTTTLRDVFFLTPEKGWVVGSQNVIRTTDDGGNTWTPQVSPVSSSITLRAVFFTSATKGWAVGTSETLLTTDDGGATWTGGSTPSGLDYNDLIFTSPDTGYIVGGGGLTGLIKRTTNGGQTWSTATVDRILYSVHFISGTKGWVCGSRGVIYRTTNGTSWTQQAAPGANQTVDLTTIFMLSEQEGWACGNPSNLKRTLDGGATWTNSASGTNAGKTGIYFSDNLNGWTTTTTPLGGGDCPSGCPFRYTTNGGASWVSDTLRVVTINRLRFREPSMGWAAADGGLVIKYNALGASIGEPAASASMIRMGPNPVSDWLSITSEEPLRAVEVYNAMGALVLVEQGSISGIDAAPLPPGSYAIRFTTRAGRSAQVQRFMKE